MRWEVCMACRIVTLFSWRSRIGLKTRKNKKGQVSTAYVLRDCIELGALLFSFFSCRFNSKGGYPFYYFGIAFEFKALYSQNRILILMRRIW
jgi:hypothetical protein